MYVRSGSFSPRQKCGIMEAVTDNVRRRYENYGAVYEFDNSKNRGV